MGRSGLLVLLLLASAPYGANADLGGGVLGFLLRVEEESVAWRMARGVLGFLPI
mgnify:CR=1 FL=1